MAFDTYTEISVAADEVKELIGANGSRLDAATAQISSVVSALTAISTQYGPIVDAINTMQAADPTNTAKTALKDHITQLLADFNSLQARASTLDALVHS